jgi:subtilisin-like proprotein convertase family protein
VLDSDARTAYLNSFNGVDPNGKWVLFIADMAVGDLSTLDSWGLQISGTTGSTINTTPTTTLQGGTYFGIWLNGIVGRTYQIQCSSNMADWTAAASVVLSSSPYFWVDSSPMAGSKFYRAVLQP